MKAIIGTALISSLKPNTKEYDIWDKKLTGLILRVQPNGKMVYRCEYGRGKRITIGRASVLTPAQARDRAKQILGDAAKGIDPKQVEKKPSGLTLRKFIENDYSHWVKAHRKSGSETVTRIKIHFFEQFGAKPIAEITPLAVEKWRSTRLQHGIASVTANRDIAALKGVLSKAAEWNFIETNPLAKLKLLKIDNPSKVRFLKQEEEKQLRLVLDEREALVRASRDTANLWRKERGYNEMPSLESVMFVDYLKPMVLISLNTGLRKGELFNLKWENVDFSLSHLTVVGEIAKSGKTRHIPLNTEALDILKNWQLQSANLKGLVFPGKNGEKIIDVKKSWMLVLKKAGIINFRWHDMRHHFASRLVMLGIDLNTVRELLGHADLKMTLRYAHLAPEHKANAVEKLVAQS